MYIGAIITIAGEKRASRESIPAAPRAQATRNSPQLLLGSPTAFSDVLGQTLLDRMIQRLRGFGIDQVSVISEDTTDKVAAIDGQTSGGGFWSVWDSVVSQYLNQGIEKLFLARLGPYVEVEVPDLVHFHSQHSKPLTQVYDEKGPLDVVLVDAADLRAGDGSYRSRLSTLIPQRNRYRFSGYSNRLAEPADFRRLVNDAFLSRCAVQPVGHEVRAGIWIADGSVVDKTATIEAPAYIGTETRIGASCCIGGSSAIERSCEIDCGTTIEDCCVFPGTYVGMGLNMRHCLVSGSKLFHLGRKIEMEFNDRHLIADLLAPRNQMTNAASRLLRPVRTISSSGLSAKVSKVASLVSNRFLSSLG